MPRENSNISTYKKLWDSFNEMERNAVLFLAHTNVPTSLDALMSLTGISAVQAVNIMEKLKGKKIGKGI